MSGPWERYQPQVETGPWTKYQTAPAVDEIDPSNPQRTLPEELMRQGGLTARAAVRGAAALPLAAGDFINRALNMIPGVNLKLPSEVTDRGLAAVLPTPETGAERIAAGGAEALAGGAPMVQAGRALANAATPVVQGMGRALASSPTAQAVSGGLGGVAGSGAAEAGADPVTQLVAALAAGTITPVAFLSGMEALKATGRGVGQITKPFSAGGREEVVGNAMKRLATDPKAAAANLADVPEYVPGSAPTTAQGARDIGLLQAERALASKDPLFAARKSQNNAARNVELDRVSGTPEQLEQARTARAVEAKGLYREALDETPKATPEVREALADLQKRPSFREALSKAVKLAEDEGEAVPRAGGAKRTGPATGLDTDADDLIMAVRKLGGINSADPNVGGDEIRALAFSMDPRGPVFTKQTFGGSSNRTATTRGHALEEMARKLYEKGYIDEPDPVTLMDKLSEASTGVGQTFSRFRTPPNQDPLAQAIEGLTKQMATKGKSEKPIDLAGVGGVKLAHYTKMALDDMIGAAKRTGNDNEARTLIGIKDKLLGTVESDDFSPSYNKARTAYSEASKPVNRMEALQDIQARTAAPGPDVTGDAIRSQAKWTNIVTKNLPELAETLTPDQVSTLKRIGKDLDRSSLSDNVGRAAGSNTFQNLSTANVIGAALGSGGAQNAVIRTLAKPIDWLYRFPEAQIQDLMIKAMLDPEAGRIMMSKATPKTVEWIGKRLTAIAHESGYRAGGVTAAGQRRESEPQE